MRLPKKWLCEYVDFNVTDEEFVERMMWRGFELAGIDRELSGVSASGPISEWRAPVEWNSPLCRERT